MSLLGKRHTMLLLAAMLTAALACAAVLVAAGSAAPANAQTIACDADPMTPDCLAITDVSPEPDATNVPLEPAAASATFNQLINTEELGKIIRLINVDIGKRVDGTEQYTFGTNELAIALANFKCGTTYKVIVGGRGSRAVRTDSGLKIHEVPAGVTLTKRGVASWKFDTVPC